jgi:N utilization substance protein A
VIVPDDQLSLAIGREGQNARLAAKLTGWRIDIKSLTEAAAESLALIDDPVADPSVAKNEQMINKIEIVLAKKEANRPITSEDYTLLNRLVGAVEGRIVALKAMDYERIHKERADARKHIPAEAWAVSLDELELSTRVQTVLSENGVTTYGDILMKLEAGDEALLAFSGFGQKALEEVKAAAEAYTLDIEPLEIEAEEELVDEAVEEVEAAAVEEEAIEEVEEIEEEVVEEVEEEELLEEEIEEIEEEEIPEMPAIDDLDISLVQLEREKKPESKKVIVVKTDEVSEEEEEKSSYRGKELVFDEQLGRVVTKRKRKSGRRRPRWEDYEGMDTDDVFEDEI